jgi:hypothetical protein
MEGRMQLNPNGPSLSGKGGFSWLGVGIEPPPSISCRGRRVQQTSHPSGVNLWLRNIWPSQVAPHLSANYSLPSKIVELTWKYISSKPTHLLTNRLKYSGSEALGISISPKTWSVQSFLDQQMICLSHFLSDITRSDQPIALPEAWRQVLNFGSSFHAVRICLKKLTVVQLVNKFHASYRSQLFIIIFARALHCPYPETDIQYTSHFIYFRSILILSFHLGI